ncbi:hypothetical protein BJF96_g6442 [Verticillium dahliae]|uniref:Uncharacterized protein n=1 Tax=Verticillium dahliae TaxID=27337 RepID=A0AA44WEU1_VERDA|nr:hypothetical protein BJF96_g6442 [Verticillium dahliae]
MTMMSQQDTPLGPLASPHCAVQLGLKARWNPF